MSSRLRRGAGLAVLTSLVGTVCLAVPAHAAVTPSADAFVVSSEAIPGQVAVPPTPMSTFPPGGTSSTAGLSAGPFVTQSALTATTGGSVANGTSNASATVDQLSINLTRQLASFSLSGVNSTCTANQGGATGSGTITGGSVTVGDLPPFPLPVGAAPNTPVVLANLGTVVMNEQTTAPDGKLTVNALHLTLNSGANLVVGHTECAGAAPTPVSITKASPQESFTAGQTINYTYTVTNNTTQALSNIAVTDSSSGTPDPSVDCSAQPTTLQPGESKTCTASYTATPADVTAGQITDTATVTGTLADSTTVTGTSNQLVIPAVSTGGPGSIRVTKRADERDFDRVGERIRYTFRVSNTGTTPLTGVAVTDNGPGTPTVTCPSATLAPGTSEYCHADYTITREDVSRGYVRDRATAVGTSLGTTVTDQSDWLTLRYDRDCRRGDDDRCDRR